MTGVIYEYYLASFHKTLFIFAFYEILMFFAYTLARPSNEILCNSSILSQRVATFGKFANETENPHFVPCNGLFTDSDSNAISVLGS